MNDFILLHFSDLHFGMGDHFLRMPQLFNYVKEDILKLCKLNSFSIDAVIFSGDVVFSGINENYVNLNNELLKLWVFFNDKLKCDPYLLCVPGNHDMQRPEDDEPYSFMIENVYFHEKNFRNTFWKNTNKFKNYVNEKCFYEFENWYDNTPLRKPDIFTKGLIYGDFSAIIKKESLSIGFVGLNSAYFHFSDTSFKKLELNERQIHAVCGEDIDTFCKEANDFCFLITHHGKEWLEKNSEDHFDTYIYPPGRFFAHIFGHTHDSLTIDQNICGSEARRYLQGKSLFGMKDFFNKGSFIPRYEFGYNLIKLSIEDNFKKCRVWPRSSSPRHGGGFNLDKDPGYKLDDRDDSLLLGETQLSCSLTDQPSKSLYPDSPVDNIQEIQTKVRIRREKIFSKFNRDRIRVIEDSVINLWNKHNGPPWDAYHDFRHNLAVEAFLFDIIPENKSSYLNQQDWFCLVASIWLHEIGMIIGLLEKDLKSFSESEENFIIEVRNTHEQRTIKFLDSNRNIFRLDQDDTEFQIIKELCLFHRIHENSMRLDPEIAKYHPRLLSAFLHLSLLLHIDHHYSDKDLFNLLHTPGISWETKFHWLKIKWIKDIEILHNDLEIKLYLFGPTKSSTLVNFLPEKILEDMYDKFNRIKDILIKGKVSFFTDISYEVRGQIADLYVDEMELIKSNIELEELSSASEAYETILNTLIKFSDSRYKPYDLIVSYFNSIEKILGIRPCHASIRNIRSEISEIMNSSYTNLEKLKLVKNTAFNRKQEKEKIFKSIQEFATPFIVSSKSILLYGYSTMVLAALSSATERDKIDCTIYVCECRGKTQFNSENRMIYNDGIHYISRVKALGFKKIVLIPDIAVGNLMKRDEIQKVFFGANGIDSKSGSFGHTCGHLSIADLAYIYKIPVFVVADTHKIGDLKWKENLYREIKWIPYYRSFEDIFSLDDCVNPREDIVDPDRISIIITENGPKFPYEIDKLNVQKVKQE